MSEDAGRVPGVAVPMVSSRVPVAPPDVVRVAQRRGLGALGWVRREPSPLAAFVVCVVVSLVLVGGIALVMWLSRVGGVGSIGKRLGVLVLFAGFLAVVALGIGFYVLFSGRLSVYGYAAGIVWTRRRRVDAACWAEMDTLRMRRKANGAPSLLALMTLDGREVEVPVEDASADSVDPLGAELEAIFKGMGRSILVTRRVLTAAERRAALPMLDRVGLDSAVAQLRDPGKWGTVAVVVGFVSCFATGFALWKTGLLPGPLAAVAGPLLTAVAMFVVAALRAPEITSIAGFYCAVAGVVGVIAAVDTFSRFNGVVVAVATIAVEAALVVGVGGVVKRLPAMRPARSRRRRLAGRPGWRFVAHGPVPVAGPKTAVRLIGVPTSASTADGDGAVTGTVNGYPILIADRVRRPPRVGDEVQTVWVLQLPMSLPYLCSPFFALLTAHERLLPGSAQRTLGRHKTVATPQILAGVRGPDLAELAEYTTDLDFACAVATEAVRFRATVPGLTSWWIDGPWLYGVTRSARTPAEPTATALAELAATLPWPALQPHATSER